MVGTARTAGGSLQAHSASATIRAGEGVFVDPPDGKIPYQSWAVAKRQENFAKRATADPVNKCFLPGVPRVNYMHTRSRFFKPRSLSRSLTSTCTPRGRFTWTVRRADPELFPCRIFKSGLFAFAAEAEIRDVVQ